MKKQNLFFYAFFFYNIYGILYLYPFMKGYEEIVLQKPVAYTAMLGGWSVCAYLFSKVWLNLIEIVTTYYYYVIAYVFVTGKKVQDNMLKPF